MTTSSTDAASLREELAEAGAARLGQQDSAKFNKALDVQREALQELEQSQKGDPDKVEKLRRRYLKGEQVAARNAPRLDVIKIEPWVVGGSAAPLRVTGRVASCTDPPELWALGDEQRLGYVFELVDDSGYSRRVETTLVFSTRLADGLRAALNEGHRVEVLGSLIAVQQGKRSVPRLAVHRTQKLTRRLVAIGADHHEQRAARVLAAKQPNLLRHIVRELRAIRGVVTNGLTREFRLAEIAIVLQAVSTGQLVDTNPRVHTLVIGEPASGKKILADYAEVLAPVFDRVEASSATRAGLAGHCAQAKGRLVAEPGVLAKAHLGVVTIEDLHGLAGQQRKQVFGALALAMEDGRVKLSNAASSGFVAHTGICFDLNRQSHLTGDPSLATGGSDATVADIGLRTDLLSRIDAIFELHKPPGSDRAGAVDMLGAQAVRGQQREHRERALQVLVAWLCDKYPEVDLSPVEDEAKRRLDKLFGSMDQWQSSGLSARVFYRRMANSLTKLMAASARVHNRGTATLDDLKRALRVVGPKVEFIWRLVTAKSPSMKPRSQRHRRYWRAFGEEPVSPSMIMDRYNVPRRTVMRDLIKYGIGEKVGHGKYRLKKPRSA